ncbi:hypothetical protein VPH35_088207 [Triticum aestivum]
MQANQDTSTATETSPRAPHRLALAACPVPPIGAPHRRPSWHLATTCRWRRPRPAARGVLDLHLQMNGTSGRDRRWQRTSHSPWTASPPLLELLLQPQPRQPDIPR